MHEAHYRPPPLPPQLLSHGFRLSFSDFTKGHFIAFKPDFPALKLFNFEWTPLATVYNSL